jgi:uncharacterized protein YkwD
MHPIVPCRLFVSALAACALAVGLPATASAASPCAAGDGLPARLGDTALRSTTLCLINRERAAHGLRRLRLDSRLTRAARRHSRDMVAHHYFAHDSRTGGSFKARIARTGWMKGRSRWSVGENLAWGTGGQATPRAIVNAWMRSAGHRHNILQPRFRVIGIGIHLDAHGGRAGATYTTDFGS